MKLEKQKKLILVSVLVPVFLTLFFFLLRNSSLLTGLESKVLDARFHYATHHNKANKDVVVVLIDEASLQSMQPLVGRWPWPRSLYGELIDFFVKAGAKGVLFDILFTEPQVPRNNNGELGESDQALVMSSAGSGLTHHALQIINDTEDELNKTLINRPMPKDFVELFSLKNVKAKRPLPKFNNFYLPLDEIWQNTSAMGVVEFASDPDGIYRSTHLLRPYQGHFFPVLSMSYVLKHAPFKNIVWKDEEMDFDGLKVPLLLDGKYLINMKKEITNYSIGGIFSSIQKINAGKTDGLMVHPEEFKDKIIIVGASAVGVEDLKMTTIGKSVPGVYLHASVISNFLDRDFISQFSPVLTFLIVFIINLLIGLLILKGTSIALPSGLFSFFFVGSLLAGFYQFDHQRQWVLLVAPLASLSLNFLAFFIIKTFTEGKEKRFLKAAFSNYISPELIEIMYKSGEAPKLGGDVGIRTAYFTDIQGFSTFSEKLSATKLVELLNEYLSAMTDILISEQGTLDKYEGDAIIAFFGAPMPLPDHALRAVRTALLMQEKLGELRNKWSSEGDKWPAIVHEMRMRIGINTGEIVTGNMGSKMRMNYTMMGDAVNLAARLEEAAKQYGVFVQISHYTYNEVKDHFICRELDTIRVVGKSEPITTYEPLMSANSKDELLMKLNDVFASALTLYKNQKWDEAISLFKESLVLEYERFPTLKHKTNPSKVYIERCEFFKKTPPGDTWDGVFELTHK